jgi:hypothetical protein
MPGDEDRMSLRPDHMGSRERGLGSCNASRPGIPSGGKRAVPCSEAVSNGVVFKAICRQYGIPEPVAEFRFAAPRRWRFDWAWGESKVALEIQGGIFTSGRHVRGAAMLKEYEKLNTAASLGWRVLFVTPKQLSEPATYELIKVAVTF